MKLRQQSNENSSVIAHTAHNMLGLAFPEVALQKSVATAIWEEISKTYPKVITLPSSHRYFIFIQVSFIEFFLFSLFKKKRLERQILDEIKDVDQNAVGVYILNKIPETALNLLQ